MAVAMLLAAFAVGSPAEFRSPFAKLAACSPALGAFQKPVRVPLAVARISAIRPRADTKLGTKGMIEIRHISEAGIQCNIDHSPRFRHQPDRRPAQPSAEDILVRAKASELVKHPKEVVAAKFRFSRKENEPVVRIRMTLDVSNDSRNARLRSR